MLARLWHDARVRRDDEQREVDAGRACDHRANECLVSGHVDDTELPDAVEVQRCEAEIDGDAATLLLWQPIGVHAGERAHECGLAMVDVSCGAEDHPTTAALPTSRAPAADARP